MFFDKTIRYVDLPELEKRIFGREMKTLIKINLIEGSDDF